MSQEAGERNIELSRRAVDAWNRQDVEALIELTDPACTWEPALEAMTDGRRYVGHSGWSEYFRDLGEIADSARSEVREYRAAGDEVVALGEIRIVWKSGVELVQEAGTVLTWRDGKAFAVKAYMGQAEALAAVGLSAD